MLTPFLGRDLRAVKHHNRAVVLRVLRRYGPISRGQIADITRLKPATVSKVVAELVAARLVREVGSAQARGSHRAGGRRQILLDLNPEGAFVIGVQIGIRLIRAARGDLQGRLVSQRVAARPEGESVRTLALAADLARSVIAEVAGEQVRPLGVGVVSPGIVDPWTGVIHRAPQLGWSQVPVRAFFSDALGLPVVVDSLYRAIMLGEMFWGAARDVQNALLVHIATTIGGALLLNGCLFTGDACGAAQIGHLVVQPDGPWCPCGGRGCLDAVASEAALVKRLAALEPAERAFEPNELEALYAAARRGEAPARSLVADVARSVGVALNQALALLDLDFVIVTGAIEEAGDCFFEPLRQTVEAHLRYALRRVPRIVPGTFGAAAPLVGAVALALEHFLYRTIPYTPAFFQAQYDVKTPGEGRYGAAESALHHVRPA
jgi:predicted NBD/HSP70 family sugar kinase